MGVGAGAVEEQSWSKRTGKGWCRGDASRAQGGERVEKGQVREERRQQKSRDILITCLRVKRAIYSSFHFLKLLF